MGKACQVCGSDNADGDACGDGSNVDEAYVSTKYYQDGDNEGRHGFAECDVEGHNEHTTDFGDTS